MTPVAAVIRPGQSPAPLLHFKKKMLGTLLGIHIFADIFMF
jgi:hypothetical protein